MKQKNLLSELTINQQGALQRFALANGDHWKQKLLDCWMSGRYPYNVRNTDDSAYLQQVRNQFGPRWLRKYDADV